MNVLFLTLAYHPEAVESVLRLSRDGMQNQINAYQWALIEGLRSNLKAGETLTIVNALPVGAFPARYRGLWLAKRAYPDNFRELGGLNLPWFKQRGRARSARRELERWVAASPENRTILVYTLYLPYMRAVEAVKKRHPDVKAAVIVTDLPNELGISSGRRGWMKRIEYAMGEKSTALCRAFNGFVLLTAPMAEALKVGGRPWIVLEGLVTQADPATARADIPRDVRPAVLYTGTLNRELGIAGLLEAFAGMEDVQLWLCGRGDMENEAREAAAAHANIRCFGFVPRETALALQQKADALINPRTSEGAFTRYSFPSKTMEYMRSGKPVLCCKLEGIPREYNEYLTYIEPQTAEGIRAAVKALLARTPEERAAAGARARAFVLKNKNSGAQCARLLALLRGL